jgi:peptidoglycan/xylan/chitin deacetylase (PgdA/CDA1 family)
MSPLAGLLLRGLTGALDFVTGPRLSVLTFHRVQPVQDALFPLEMYAARFDTLLAQLARSFQVLTLGEAHRLRVAGCLPRRALAITFDDGYADNATVALPILQRHGLKATFFVATGFLDGGRMWNDTVIETVRACTQPELDLGEFDLRCFELTSAAQRHAAIDAVLPKIKYQSLAQREVYIDKLWQLAGCPALPDDLMMRSEQVVQLHEAGMEIGGHTVRHPILTETPDAQALHEITEGRSRLRQLTGAPVSVFAYPNGVPGRDFDRRHVAMVRDAGFDCAVSTAPGVVRAGADDHQWPRFTPWDPGNTAWFTRLLLQRYRPAANAVLGGR